MPESILPFTTHNIGIKHESFIAVLSVLQKTDVARLLNTRTNGQTPTGAFMEKQTTQLSSDWPAERVSHELNKEALLDILDGFQFPYKLMM